MKIMIEDNALEDILIPLKIISLEQPFRGKTRLQKLVFLFNQKESGNKFDFKFEAAPLGPLSHKLNHLLERIKKLELLKETVSQTPNGNDVILYTLTKSGSKFLDFGITTAVLPHEVLEEIRSTFSEYGAMQYIDLLDYVHIKYPEYKL
jgi:uncharacterized protein YwgA